MDIRTIINECIRGCGYRKPGGLYLVCDPGYFTCLVLPIPLTVCPCCNQGIKPSRGWTWINAHLLTEGYHESDSCASCPQEICILRGPEKVGLLWVGEQFYKTPEDFAHEAREQGISRRINNVPKEFKLGQTVVWLAHRKAIPTRCPTCNGDGVFEVGVCQECKGEQVIYIPGVFTVFKPQRIEYIVRGTETEEQLENMIGRGIEPVRLVGGNGG